MWKILEQIWELPWYEVLVIAVCDDVILFIKLWPVYVVIVFLYGWYWYRKKKKKEKNEKIII